MSQSSLSRIHVCVYLNHFVWFSVCLSAVFQPRCWHAGHHLSHHRPNTRFSCTLMEWFVKLLSATPTTRTHTSPASSPSIPSSGQPCSWHLATFNVVEVGVKLEEWINVHLTASSSGLCMCVHSGGSTVTVNGFYLHSALQPQMVLTAATEGKVFQVVSLDGPHRVSRH